MDRETEAGYGAWCAIKSSLPSKTDIRAVSGLHSFSGILNTLTPLAIPESCRDVFSIENLFISRYSRALTIIRRFFSSSSAELFSWLKGEYDFRNILLLLKNIYGFRNDEKTARMLYPFPTAAVSPPDPALSATADTIINAYNNSSASPLFSGIHELSDNKPPFHLIEFIIIYNRYTQLFTILNLLEKKDQQPLNDFLAVKLSTLRQNSKDRNIPSKIEIQLKSMLRQLQYQSARNTVKSSVSEINMQSPGYQFIECSNARERIISVCELIGKAELP